MQYLKLNFQSLQINLYHFATPEHRNWLCYDFIPILYTLKDSQRQLQIQNLFGFCGTWTDLILSSKEKKWEFSWNFFSCHSSTSSKKRHTERRKFFTSICNCDRNFGNKIYLRIFVTRQRNRSGQETFFTSVFNGNMIRVFSTAKLRCDAEKRPIQYIPQNSKSTERYIIDSVNTSKPTEWYCMHMATSDNKDIPHGRDNVRSMSAYLNIRAPTLQQIQTA